jgi:heat shock protein HslJ
MKKYLLWLLIPLIALSLVGCDQLGSDEESNLKTVYVGPERVDCEGEGPQTCYLIKENPEDEWSLWYEEIDGFDFEPGYEYELIVSGNEVENPPAGGSSITWTLQEVVDKTPVAEVSSDETDENGPAAEEVETSDELLAQIEFVPIVVEDLGITTVAPVDWPKIEDDPLLKDAWGPGQYEFVAFHSVVGDDVQEAMAKLLSTTAEELADGTVEGEYWQEEIGGHTWAMYAIDNPDVGLVQTVSMTDQEGTVYIVSLFIETAQKDAVLQPVLENFVIEGDPVADGSGAGEAEVDEVEAEEESSAGSANLVESNWVLTTYDDGSGQLANVMPGVEVTALFTTDGRVSGSAGCNDYVSLYNVEDNSVTISLPAMTRKDCVNPPGIMIQETGFLGDLTTVASYQIKGNELQLLDEEGKVILTFLSP